VQLGAGLRVAARVTDNVMYSTLCLQERILLMCGGLTSNASKRKRSGFVYLIALWHVCGSWRSPSDCSPGSLLAAV
jgi:hypothetical protein